MDTRDRMMRLSLKSLGRVALLAVVLPLLGDRPLAQQVANMPLLLTSIGNYQQVSETRVSRTVFEYVYRATFTNLGGPVTGATATVTSLVPATTIVDGTLTFGPAGALATAPSIDT